MVFVCFYGAVVEQKYGEALLVEDQRGGAENHVGEDFGVGNCVLSTVSSFLVSSVVPLEEVDRLLV